MCLEMSPCVSKTLGLSSSLKKQGIVSILSSDSDMSSNTSAASLRRTISADMSSKKWLSQDGFSSSDELHSLVEESFSTLNEEDEYGEEEIKESGAGSRFDIWAQIQEEKKKKEDEERRGQLYIWSSILSQRTEGNKSLPPPYVHPLVKRSSSSLSEKSLEICTESLGSETGWDGFSSYPASEDGDAEEEKEGNQDRQQNQDAKEPEQEFRVSKYNYLCGKKLSLRSFPPPIPSLSCQDGNSVHMRTHCDDGRLVLEAVSVPSQNNFCAKRYHGRLVLTIATRKNYENHDEEMNEEIGFEIDETFESFEEEEKEEEEDEELSFNVEKITEISKRFNGPIGISNGNPTRPGMKDSEEEAIGAKSQMEPPPIPVAQSLPPRPWVARPVAPLSTVDDTISAVCFNGYESYWRPNKPTVKTTSQNSIVNTLKLTKNHQMNSNKKHEDMVVVSWLKGCKERRRSLLFMEPFCIATT